MSFLLLHCKLSSLASEQPLSANLCPVKRIQRKLYNPRPEKKRATKENNWAVSCILCKTPWLTEAVITDFTCFTAIDGYAISLTTPAALHFGEVSLNASKFTTGTEMLIWVVMVTARCPTFAATVAALLLLLGNVATFTKNIRHPPKDHRPWQDGQTHHRNNRCLVEMRKHTETSIQNKPPVYHSFLFYNPDCHQ